MNESLTIELGHERHFGVLPAAIQLAGKNYYLVRDNNQLYKLLSARCPHAGGKIEFDGSCFECPVHGWEFTLTGECINVPSKPLLQYPVEVISGVLYAKLPQPQ